MLSTVLAVVIVVVILIVIVVVIVLIAAVGCACNSSIGMVFTTQEVTSGLCFVAAAVVLHC